MAIVTSDAFLIRGESKSAFANTRRNPPDTRHEVKKIPATLVAGIEISKGDFERRVMKQ
jgi:hypothetical protein